MADTARTAEDAGRQWTGPTCTSPPTRRRRSACTAICSGSICRRSAPADTKSLAYSVLTDAQKKRFEETLELDFSFGMRGVGRFRCNVFNQSGAVGAVYRLIPEKIQSFEELGLPPVLADAGRPPARPRARHRPDRQRQVDDAGGDDRPDQHRAPRAHPHHRRPDRVSAPAQGLPRQPARGAQRHAELRDGAARRAPRRPRRRPHRRIARPRDDRSRR